MNVRKDGNRPSLNETDSSNEDRPTMPYGMDTSGENALDPSGFAPGGNRPGSRPAGDSFNPGDGDSFGNPAKTSGLPQLGLVGISAALLAMGLLIVLKKKY